MPREIDCPDCEGTGTIDRTQYGMSDTAYRTCKTCKGEGKIKVYTEVELQEAVKKAYEKCALIVDSYNIYPNLAKAIKKRGKG